MAVEIGQKIGKMLVIDGVYTLSIQGKGILEIHPAFPREIYWNEKKIHDYVESNSFLKVYLEDLGTIQLCWDHPSDS